MSDAAGITLRDRRLGGLWGSLVGDALGVPVEFRNRATVQADPVTGMREHGTHRQPRGTWSDDSSLLLCTVDSLVRHEFSPADMGGRFVGWLNDGFWTATGDVFDVGGTTCTALMKIAEGCPAEQAGGRSEDSNGNGSLMRILPVVLRFAGGSNESFADRIGRVSAITHGHARARLACVFYGLVIRHLLAGAPPRVALNSARREFTEQYQHAPEFPQFRPVLEDDLENLPEGLIVSTGYVLHTLHASLWCLLTTTSFKECVLKAVNLGGDTDTTGCVAGGLAGVAYGLNAIPTDWVGQLARHSEVERLFHEFVEVCEGVPTEPPFY